ncbi:aminoglycoside phosphotransferase family protein [Streptacidiphilus sp. NEAU-YB345]|uniref:Aminoglycoside phosphotransferase family protein n=1 Tax=Streptacidiphilus fuscans TaxID=2789292 RepID=A0A931B7G4_9ACTN|nr:aminoglycoside phosphotransferase family protein [Streptacidiphilus fuscans]
MTAVDASREHLREACEAVGLLGQSDRAELIRLGENAMWRLPSRGLVARIARDGQQSAAAREVRVASWLAVNGIPAVKPAEDLEQALEVSGRAVTWWHDLGQHRPDTVAELAALLRRLHALPVPDGLSLGHTDPFVRLDERIGQTDLDAGQQAWLHERLAELRQAWDELPSASPEVVVHGDAWAGNVAVTPDGNAFLLDFERTAIGPREWDLASIAVAFQTSGTVSADRYRSYCRAYGLDVTDWPGYPTLRGARELRLVCFAAQTAVQHPTAHAQAVYRLECLQGLHGPRPWSWSPVP